MKTYSETISIVASNIWGNIMDGSMNPWMGTDLSTLAMIFEVPSKQIENDLQNEVDRLGEVYRKKYGIYE
jgi:hypothetical protein